MRHRRWWIYQRERFPVLSHGMLIAVFSLSALAYSSGLRGQSMPPTPALLVAFASAFLFFLQLRVLDEFKDYEEDAEYRPYRAVPRGVVTLRELGWVGVLAAAVQAALASSQQLWLLAFLVAVWGYLALMRVEFFAPEWLKGHPSAYLISHMVVVPLIAFYVTACDWLTVSRSAPRGLEWFLLASFFNGLVIEIGRKVRAPGDEERGVPTYTAAWGIRNATFAWAVALALAATSALIAASRLDATRPAVAVLVPSLALAVGAARAFARRPSSAGGRRIEQASGAWALLLYLVLGVAPLVGRS